MLRPHLDLETARDIEDATFVGMRVRDAVAVLKPCATDGQRCELFSVLAAAAPPRCAARDSSGLLRRVAKFLGMQRGKRSIKRGGRPYIFDQAVDSRAALNDFAENGSIFMRRQIQSDHRAPHVLCRPLSCPCGTCSVCSVIGPIFSAGSGEIGVEEAL